jgi:predicted transcriptional regulator
MKTFTIDPEMSRRLKHLAEAMGREESTLATEAIERYLADEERVIARITAGLVAADAGQTIPHEEIDVWAAALGTDSELPLPKPRG